VGQGNAQDEPGLPKPKVLLPGAAGETLQSINANYNRQLLQLERQRLERLGQLAERQKPEDAAETYETLFRLAIANNLFGEAEPAAERVLKSTKPSPVVHSGIDSQHHRRGRRGIRRVAGRRTLVGDRSERIDPQTPAPCSTRPPHGDPGRING
jgi:hypothetical protein